jgi:rhodanese-related sulfurtransferase
MLDGQINPREWYNWHPREFQPYHYDLHKFIYERHQYAHVHHLLCHQVYAKDMLRLAKYPEPHAVVIDCRTDTAKMHSCIPNSVWLPRDEVEYALQLTDAEFLEMYAFPKPKRQEDVVLISHNGMASEQAGWEFKKAFYTHVYNYRGGTNELLGEQYADFAMEEKLKPWKGPFPQNGIYVDEWSKRKLLTRTGPFDKRYEMQDFALPDLELERPRHPEEGPNSNMPYGLQ